jgi:hypothetical protein
MAILMETQLLDHATVAAICRLVKYYSRAARRPSQCLKRFPRNWASTCIVLAAFPFGLVLVEDLTHPHSGSNIQIALSHVLAPTNLTIGMCSCRREGVVCEQPFVCSCGRRAASVCVCDTIFLRGMHKDGERKNCSIYEHKSP